MKTNLVINFFLVLFMTQCFTLLSIYKEPVIKPELKSAYAHLKSGFDKFYHFWVSNPFEHELIMNQATVQHQTLKDKRENIENQSRFNQKTKQGIRTIASNALKVSVGICSCYCAWLIFPKENRQNKELLTSAALFIGGVSIIKNSLPYLYDGLYTGYRGIQFKNILEKKNNKSQKMIEAIDKAQAEYKHLARNRHGLFNKI